MLSCSIDFLSLIVIVDVRILVQNSPTKTAVKGAHCPKYVWDLSFGREIRWKTVAKG